MMYYAIIGDIKKSKKIKNRFEIQEQLNRILEHINESYGENIAAKFLITLGDEFQGLLNMNTPIFEIVKYIQREMYPIELRFGIGIGEITTEINKNAAIGTDGPAFYAARNAIVDLHQQEKRLKKQAADIKIELYEKDLFEIMEINTLLILIKTIEDSWNDRQRLTIWDMMQYQDSQEMCAKRQNTTQSTVARRLAEGKYVVYTSTIKVVNEAIRRGEQIWK